MRGRFDDAWLDDPGVFAVGRRPSHSDHRWYANSEEGVRGESSYEVLLDGQWRYRHFDAPDLVPPGLENPGCDLSEWDEIPVPAHVQLHGYDRPQYVNVQYPWDGRESVEVGRAPRRYNPVSTYARDVVLDEAPADGESLRLVIGGAESACALWVNGEFIGYSTDSFTPAEFDVGRAMTAGANRVVIRVWKWCAASWIEGQDFFRFSGLFRSVRLVKIPRAHVEDLHVSSSVSDDLAMARVDVDLDLVGPDAPEALVRVELRGVGPLATDERGHWRIDVASPHLWNAEDPYLYDLWIEVKNRNGRVIETIIEKVGLRRFGIEDGLLRINGRRIVFKGINRHEFGPKGRVVDRASVEADLRSLKRLGVNAIRTSHYPNSSYFYDLCDLYGFYVIDEMNLESHGMWDLISLGLDDISSALPGDRREWLPALIDRADSMILRDRNHPSVVMWSLGNESFGGTVLRDLAEHVRRRDARPIHYEGIARDPRYPTTSDVHSQMYTSAKNVREFLRTHRDKPFILCEFAHSMGHAFGGVDEYMSLMHEDDLFQGGLRLGLRGPGASGGRRGRLGALRVRRRLRRCPQ